MNEPATSISDPLRLDRGRCISCAGCVGTCPELALDMFGLDLQIFQARCTACTLCVRMCPVGALSLARVGKKQ